MIRVYLLLMSWSPDNVCNLRHFKQHTIRLLSPPMIYVITCGVNTKKGFTFPAFFSARVMLSRALSDPRNFLYELKKKIMNNAPINFAYTLSNWPSMYVLFVYKNGLACVGFENPHLIGLTIWDIWAWGGYVVLYVVALLKLFWRLCNESKSNFANETHSFSFCCIFSSWHFLYIFVTSYKFMHYSQVYAFLCIYVFLLRLRRQWWQSG